MVYKIVSLTGTPGTGKTTISEKLEEEYEVLHLTEFIREKEIGEGNKPVEVDIEKLKEEFQNYLETKDSQKEVLVVEGHLSHYLDADYCIVLRTEPQTLRERLEERNYPDKKINENVESEKIDYILMEAAEKFENLYEINNTDEEIGKILKGLKYAIKDEKTSFGNINWL